MGGLSENPELCDLLFFIQTADFILSVIEEVGGLLGPFLDNGFLKIPMEAIVGKGLNAIFGFDPL